jgi:hypothetical protein
VGNLILSAFASRKFIVTLLMKTVSGERLAEHPAWQSWRSLRQNLRIPAQRELTT